MEWHEGHRELAWFLLLFCLRYREISAEESCITETERTLIQDHEDKANETGPLIPLLIARATDAPRSLPWPCAHLRLCGSLPHHWIPSDPAAPKLDGPGWCTDAPTPTPQMHCYEAKCASGASVELPWRPLAAAWRQAFFSSLTLLMAAAAGRSRPRGGRTLNAAA